MLRERKLTLVSGVKKRLVAVFLCLCVIFQFFPGMTAAALGGEDTKNTPEPMTVTTDYDSVDRNTATITFHKEGIKNDGLNLIMLVDVSKAGAQSYEQFVRMMKESGAGYIFDQSMDNMKVRMLAYQNIINQDTGFVPGKEGFLRVFEDHGVSGEGNPNEVTALSKVTDIVEKELTNDLPTVVLWVPGQVFGQSETAIDAELQKLKSALNENDAFITWEMSDKPRDMLVKYASTYTLPHDETKEEFPAAFARADAEMFRADMATSLEQVVHDHYHNIRVSFALNDAQSIVKKITKAEFKSPSSQTNIEFQIADDGQSVDMHIVNLCRQIPIDIILTVELDTTKYIQENVIDGKVFTIPDDGSNGGLHSGIFDEDIVENLSVEIPTAQVDRRQYTVSYNANGATGTVSSVKRMPGQLVAIPDGTELTKKGENFGGWMVTSSGEMQNRRMTAGEIIPMPQQDLVLTAAWGHLEVELEINHTQGGQVYGNKMMEELYYDEYHYYGYDDDFGPLDFAYVYAPDSLDGFKPVYDKDGEAIEFRIKSVVFDDELIRVDRTPDPDDPLRVGVPDIQEAVYAREIGATDNDLVVAYLIPWSEGTGDDLQLVISGPGGVTAPDNSTGLISGSYQIEYDKEYQSWSHNVQEIKLNDLLNVDNVTNMYRMFAFLPNLTSLDLGDNFNTSNVTNMKQMFCYCPKLETLDLGSQFDTSKVTDMVGMFATTTSNEHHNYVEPKENDSSLTTLVLGDKFNTENVESMVAMFRGDTNLVNLDLGDQFDTSSVTNMECMFDGCLKLENLDLGPYFSTKAVTNMTGMFQFCRALNTQELVKNFNVSQVDSMSSMFSENDAVTEFDLSNWVNNGEIEGLDWMFYQCDKLQSVTLGNNFSTINVTSMHRMFMEDEKLESINFGTGFNTSNTTDFSEMFYSCKVLEGVNTSGWNVSKAKNMRSMFYRCEALESVDLSQSTCEDIQNVGWMFAFMNSATTIKPPQFHFQNGDITLENVFQSCGAVTSLDLSDWTGLQNITSTERMFMGCSSATSITFGGEWETTTFSKLGTMADMFWACAALQSLDLGGWDLPNLTNVSGMLGSNYALKQLDLSWKSLPTNTSLLNCDDFFANLTSAQNMTVTVQDENGTVNEQSIPALKKMLSDDGGGSFKPTTIPANFLDDETISNQMLNNVSEVQEPSGEAEQPEMQTPSGEAEQPEMQEPSGEAEQPETQEPSGEVEQPETQKPSGEAEQPETQEPSGEVEQPETQEPSGEAEQPETQEPSGEAEQPETQEPSGEAEQPETQEPSGEAEQPETQEPSGGVEQPETPEQSGEVDQSGISAQVEGRRIASKMQTSVIKKMPIVTADPGVVEDNPEMVVVSDTMDRLKVQTPPGSTVTYRVTVKYVGDTGAKSGTIEMAYPIPAYMVQDPDETIIEVSDIKDTGTATGFMGGRIVTQPYLDTSDPSAPVLRGTFEGLFTGTEIEIDITCNNNRLPDFNTEGYMFWDGTAYAQSGNASATSKTIRLWYTENQNPTEPTTKEYRVEYQFEGDLPSGVELPLAAFHKENDPVTTASSPLTNDLKDLYTFSGWVRKDTGATVTPGGTFEMPGKDVILVGTWKLNEENIPKLTVKYQYAGEVPPGAPSIGNTSDDVIQSPQTYFVGTDHTIVKVPHIGTVYTFPGWVPSLTVQGENVPLTSSDGGKTYQGNYNDSEIVVDMSGGVLFTSQFKDIATKNASDVVVTFTGTWEIKRHDITITVDGGTASPNGTVTILEGEDQKIQFTPNPGYVLDSVTVDGKPDTLQPDGSYLFEDVTDDHTIHVVYKPQDEDTHQITVTVEGGTADPVGVVTVPDGDDKVIQFTPNPGYTLDKVTVDGVPGELQPDGSYHFENVTGNHTIHVVYKPQDEDTHQITVTVEGGTADPVGVVTVPDGDDKVIQFTPNPGYTLDKVTVDGVPGELQPDGSYHFENVTGNHTIHVVYKPQDEDTHQITVTVEGGAADPVGVVTVPDGDDKVIQFTPNPGYTLDKVTVDGVPGELQPDGSYHFENVTGNHTIHVVYKNPSAPDGGTGGGGSTPPKYTLTYESNGGTSYPQESYGKGTEVVIDKTPVREGYTFDGWYLDKEFTQKVTQVTMDKSITVYAKWIETEIPEDLNGDDHYAYVIGYPDGMIHPQGNITRGEVATIFFRLLTEEARQANLTTENTFGDIKSNQWYNTAISTMESMGIVTGYEDGDFHADQSITRAEFAAIAARFEKGATATGQIFTDIAGHWAEPYILKAAQKGWILGQPDGTFAPNRYITRAEAMTLINRVLKRLPETPGDLLEGMNQWPDNMNQDAWYYLPIQEATNSHDHVYHEDNVHETWTAMTDDPDWKQYE